MMVFLAVNEAGSFTLAAERLGIPKANVSRKVSRLEQQLGVVLLERSTRRQRLTEAGQRYLAHCKRIHQEVDLAEASVSELLHNLTGQLHIGASVAIGQLILRPALSQFMQRYPDIQLRCHLTNQRLDLIEEGYDILIRVGELQDSRLIGKHLGSAKRGVYASPAYLKQHSISWGEISDIDDLQHCHFLLMSKVHGDGRISLRSGDDEREFRVTPRLLVDDFSLVQQAVLESSGVAILPDYMCNDAVARGELVNVLPEWGMQDSDFYALYPRHRTNIPKVRAFLDFIIELFAERLAS
ncbi:LysR family transcriptional regulator [Gammaproteobacteria bacterium 45_16_T64]|nr:LysR family transcriptional regulator [Gammaproteobacteria bacterium 45_16_T64]